MPGQRARLLTNLTIRRSCHGHQDCAHSRAERRTASASHRRSGRHYLGVAALGAEAVERIVKTIAVFDDFCHANDPHEEHDFGSFEADGHMIMFKIDYFDQNLSMHSSDPADPAVTQRTSSRSCLRTSL